MNLGNVYECDGFDISDNPVLVKMYEGITTNLDEYFEHLKAPSLSSLLLPQDLEDIHKVVTSVKLAGNGEKRIFTISDIMARRGFTKLAGGTNRSVYTHPQFPSIVVKVAIDNVGMRDNPAEYNNQFVLKPFCTKCFEVSADGAVGVFEKVEPIKNPVEFSNMVYDIFALSFYFVREKGVLLEDFGSKFFMNWGMRDGYGPVFLDYPYMYEPDPDKIYCDRPNDDGSICNGEIDYDANFNFLVCEKCGKRFRALDIAKEHRFGSGVLSNSLGGQKMHIKIKRGNRVINEINAPEVRNTIGRPAVSKHWKNKIKCNDATGHSSDTVTFKVVRGDKVIGKFQGGIDLGKEKFDSGIIVKVTRGGVDVNSNESTVEEEKSTIVDRIIEDENIPTTAEEATHTVFAKDDDETVKEVEKSFVEDVEKGFENLVEDNVEQSHDNIDETVVDKSSDQLDTEKEDHPQQMDIEDVVEQVIASEVSVSEPPVFESPEIIPIEDAPTEIIYETVAVDKPKTSKSKKKAVIDDIDIDLDNSNSSRPAKKQKKTTTSKKTAADKSDTKRDKKKTTKKATVKNDKNVTDPVVDIEDPKPALDTSDDTEIMTDIVSTLDAYEAPEEREDEIDEVAEKIANKEPITPELIRNSNTKMTVDDILKNY